MTAAQPAQVVVAEGKGACSMQRLPCSLGKVTACEAEGLGSDLARNAAVGDDRCCTKGMPDIKIGDLSVRQVFLKLPILLPKSFKKYFPDSVEKEAKLHCSYTLLIPPGAFVLISM